jgi:tRNA G10  N-methylase Trm11
MQKMKLWDNVRILDGQARKNTNLLQAQGLDKQITEIETEKQKFEDTENSSVEELAKLTSNDKKQDQPEINEEKRVKQKTDEQKEPVVAE